jgi:hypothetical protein
VELVDVKLTSTSCSDLVHGFIRKNKAGQGVRRGAVFARMRERIGASWHGDDVARRENVQDFAP